MLRPPPGKHVARVLEVSPTKVTQATAHMWRKVARMIYFWPAESWEQIHLELAKLRREIGDEDPAEIEWRFSQLEAIRRKNER